MRSEYIHLAYGALRYTGYYGNIWSMRSYSSATFAYALNFHASAVIPANNDSRYAAFPVRNIGSTTLSGIVCVVHYNCNDSLLMLLINLCLPPTTLCAEREC